LAKVLDAGAVALAVWLSPWAVAGHGAPPAQVAVAVVLALALAAGFRLVAGTAALKLARHRGAARRVLVVGERKRALEVLATLAGDGRGGAFPVGVLLDRDAPSRPIMGGFIAGLDQAEHIVRAEAVDDVVLALPWSDMDRLAFCLEQLRPLAVDLHLFPDVPQPFVDGHGVSQLAGVPMARVGARPLSGWRAFAKAAEDRVLALVLIILLSPVLLAVAAAIKLDSPGPVLFRQKRTGFGNHPFTCLKFRSMHVRPEEQVVRQATRDDPRVTRVGRFIRRTSLDELPQLFNVLGGTMSLVGPRPHAVSHHHHFAKLVDDYRSRHRMKPGITGWAQVNGFRGETNTVELMRARVVHDLWYIDHWSPWLDLKILLLTPFACLKATNAY
jgi:putative colanic acid biosynthesis UDP-glucose lipid carrier transferase